MRDWKPDKDDAPPLPAPDMACLEIETAKAHGGWVAWLRLTPERKARLIAHELEMRQREGFLQDWAAKKAEKPRAEKKADPRLSMWAGMGLTA